LVLHRDFYRIIQSSTATREDFLSPRALGRPVPNDPVLAALWDGVSVQNTLAQARRKSRVSPRLGSYVAILRVSSDGPIRFRRSLGPGHYTLWGEPDVLLAAVIDVIALYP
jgi:hypothetical protein